MRGFPTAHKFEGWWRSFFRLILLSTFVVPILSENLNCEKYCFASCSGFDHGEFSLCVDANLKCSCSSKLSIKNPFVIIGVAGACLIALVVLYLLYRKCIRRGSPLGTTVAQPILPNANPSSPSLNHIQYPSNSSSNLFMTQQPPPPYDSHVNQYHKW